MSSFDFSWESNIYAQQRHLNKYPFGEIVPHVMRLYAKELRAGAKLKALDLGCGTGNNLAFLAAEGFEAFGIEGSESAVNLAKKFILDQGLQAKVKQGDFAQLDFEDSFFDLVIDRESIYANRLEAIAKIRSEVFRVLKPGGHFLSFCYSRQHSAIRQDGGQEIEEGTYAEFERGPFQGTGLAHFFTQAEVTDVLMKDFELIYLKHHQLEGFIPDKKNEYAEWIACGRKRA